MFKHAAHTEVRIDDGTMPEAHCTPKLDLIRVEPGKPILGIVLDENPLKVFTHWWGGRTVPCVWEKCQPCFEHRKPDWKGYFTLFSPRTCTVAVVEVTEACRDTMARWESMHAHWRGAQLTVRRVGREKNSRLAIGISLGSTPVETLPKPIDLLDFMVRMWGASLREVDQPVSGERAFNAAVSRQEPPKSDNGLIRLHP